ncbi:hypothetical protein A33M_2502 [Rhodovulum sp. PH10]|nr:hypothetical protein A33M_2502 [Rhodovulum sp. PH10]
MHSRVGMYPARRARGADSTFESRDGVRGGGCECRNRPTSSLGCATWSPCLSHYHRVDVVECVIRRSAPDQKPDAATDSGNRPETVSRLREDGDLITDRQRPETTRGET